MNDLRQKSINLAMAAAPVAIYAAMIAIFVARSPQFLAWETARNILIESASPGIVAIGLMFVLLTAGIDLSAGMTMFVAGAVAGKLILSGWPIGVGLGTMIAVGILLGLVNGLCITRLGMLPFIMTLSAFFLLRSLGLRITQTKAMNLPDEFRQLATSSLLGVPLPVWILLGVMLAAHFVLTRTPLGRQLYAVGNDAAAAQKAGVPVRRVLSAAYVLCGGLAALGAAISLARLSAVSPTFGKGREMDAIAAAVLGGVSLFGGRGGAIGAVFGAIMIQTIYFGLNATNTDPYLFPMITAGIIYLAVLLDSLRNERLARSRRRTIRPLASERTAG